MLSSVTINCQVTKIGINPGSQLSVLFTISVSKVPMIAPLDITLLGAICFGYQEIIFNGEKVEKKAKKIHNVTL